MDLIYMVLKGKVAFYGPDDKVIGEYGPHEGLLLPENSRYWFGAIGDEEAWLLQIAGYPKGAEMSKRIPRSEEHTSELQSIMRTSYAVFCLKKKITTTKL